jgi:hypothetical protein
LLLADEAGNTLRWLPIRSPCGELLARWLPDIAIFPPAHGSTVSDETACQLQFVFSDLSPSMPMGFKEPLSAQSS